MPNDLSLNLRANVDDFTAKITQAGNLTDAQVKRMSRAFEALAKQQAAVARAQRDANEAARGASAGQAAAADFAQSTAGVKKLAGEAKDAAKAMEHVGFHTVGAKRELLVLMHELSQGRYSNFAGSLMVLGERTNAMELIFSRTGAAALGFGAAVFGVAAAVIQGAMQQHEFNNQLLLTGNFAGLTAGRIDQYAESIKNLTGVSHGTGRDAVAAMQGTGVIGPQNILAAATATARFQKLTGETAENVAKDFARMQDGVAKWAAEHNRSMHFMTAAQYEVVVSMEKAGNVEQAMGVVLDALNEQLARSENQLGHFARAWHWVTEKVTDAKAAMNSWGAGSNTDKALADAQAKLASAQSAAEAQRKYSRDGSVPAGLQRNLEAAQLAVAAAARAKMQGDDAAAAEAQRSADRTAAVEAAKRTDAIVAESHATSRLREELKKLNTDRQRELSGVGADTAAINKRYDLAEGVLRKRYKDHTGQSLANEVQNLINTMSNENAKLTAQIDEVERYGKAQDNAAGAVMRRRLAEGGDLHGKVNAGMAAKLQGLADDEDANKARLKYTELIARVRASVAAYRDLGSAREVSERQAYIEAEVQKHVGDTAHQTTDELKAQAATVRALAGIRYDGMRNEAFGKDAAKRELSFKRDLDAINRQNDALTQTGLEREHAADAAKLQASAEQELSKYPEREIEIYATLRQEIERVREARARQYTNSRSWDTGSKQATTKWAEDATNQAANAEKLVTGMFDRMATAVEKFATTGKLNLGDLWSFMASEYLRQMSRMAVAQFMPGGQGLSGLMAMFGGFGAGAGLTGSPTLDAGISAISGFAANGAGNVNAGGAYVVGEKGPELFRPSGSGSIVPNDQLGGGGSNVIHIGQGQVVNIGQGVSRAEVVAGLTRVQAATLGQVKRLVSTGRLV